MTKARNLIIAVNIAEAAYPGNVGFHEMTMFYQKASKIEIDEMEDVIKEGNWGKFKDLINRVLHVKLL